MFFAHVAAQTARIRLGTGVVTLPMEEPVRVADPAKVVRTALQNAASIAGLLVIWRC